MKRIIISAVILVILTAVSTAAALYVSKVTTEISDKIHEVETLYSNGEKCDEQARELQEMWDDFTDFTVLISDTGSALEITSSIAEIVSFAQDEDDELYASCDRAQAQIRLFKEMQTPSLWKIL